MSYFSIKRHICNVFSVNNVYIVEACSSILLLALQSQKCLWTDLLVKKNHDISFIYQNVMIQTHLLLVLVLQHEKNKYLKLSQCGNFMYTKEYFMKQLYKKGKPFIFFWLYLPFAILYFLYPFRSFCLFFSFFFSPSVAFSSCPHLLHLHFEDVLLTGYLTGEK